MIIKEIINVGIKVGIIGFILVAIIFQRLDYVVAFTLGALASNINLIINDKLLDISSGKHSMVKMLGSHLLRMLIYTVVLVGMIVLVDKWAMIIAFVGCLTIRVSILIYGIKGGIMDGHNQ